MAAGSPTATLADGSAVRGLRFGAVEVYRGIPFAKPPLGSLRYAPRIEPVSSTALLPSESPGPFLPDRFSPPQPLDPRPWGNDSLDATFYRPNCQQPSPRSWWGLNGTFSEDCLHINVFTPAPRVRRTALLPVLVWIFGGGFHQGGAADHQLEGWQAVGQYNDVVIVTFNYRVGAFGALGSWQLRTLDPDGSTGNTHVKDQQAALRWVQANIGSFGGDPQRVTLFGESAGACSVSVHMVSPLSRGLFHAAVMQSGAFVPWATKSLHVGQATFDWLAHKAGCLAHVPEPADPAAAKRQAAATVFCLRRLPAARLVSLSVNTRAHGNPYPDGWLNSTWAPTRDGVLLPLSMPLGLGQQEQEDELPPAERLWLGGKGWADMPPIARVPVLLGTNRNDGTGFISTSRTADDWLSMSIDAHQYERWAERNFPPEVASQVLATYSLRNYTPFYAASHAVGDLALHCPTHRAARALTSASSPGVWLYSFAHAPISYHLTDGGPCASGAQGAFHGAEIPFVFHVEKFLKTPYEKALSDAIWQMWRNFAWSGSPNPETEGEAPLAPLIKWPRFDNASERSLRLGTAPDSSMAVEERLHRRCGMWHDYARAGYPLPTVVEDREEL